MKNYGRKLIAMILACLLITMLVAACGNGTSPSGSPSQSASSTPSNTPNSTPGADSPKPADPVESDRTLHVAVTMDSGTLHPLNVTAFYYVVAKTYMDVLLEYNSNNEIEWKLATGSEAIDEVHHTLHLREGVTFTNGNPFTAEDVIFSMELARNHDQAFMNVETVDFEKTKVIDDHTIDLWFTKYDIGQFPAFMLMYIIDAESYDEVAMASKPIGTGPYVVTEYVANSRVVVEAREDFWGTPPAIKKIEFKCINEDAQRINAVSVGDVDMATIPSKDVGFINDLDGYTTIFQKSPSTSAAYFNISESSPIGSIEARRAVMHAIDRQSILNIVYDGQSTSPRWPVSEACRDFEPRFADMDEVYSIGYDPDKAQELADQSGLTGKTLRIITNGSEQFITMAEIVQNNLEAIGVNSEILNYDQATYWGMLMDESNYDIALYLIAGPKPYAIDLLTSFTQFFTFGWGGAARDEYQALGLKGLGTPDDKERSEILYELYQKFTQVHLWYSIAENATPWALSEDLTGVSFYADGSCRIYNWAWTA